MLRFIFPAMLCLAFCCPMVANAQCGCGATPAAAMDMSYAAPVDAGIVSAPMSTVVAAPAANCGCAAPAPACAPKPRTRKKLQRTCVDVQVPTFSRTCTTDACGCSKKQLTRGCKTVKVNKLQLVDVPVDPCKQRGSRIKGMFGKLRSAGGNGCCPAPAPACGCN